VPARTLSISLQRGAGPRTFIGNVSVNADVKGMVVLSGRVDVDDRTPVPSNATAGPAIAFALQAWVPTTPSPAGIATRVISNAAIPPDGSVDLLLPEGELNVSLRNIPFGYEVRSITSGNIDLKTGPLNVAAGSSLSGIRAIVGKVGPSGANVSGRVTGLQGGTITLMGGATASATTPIRPDGTFEFPSVPPGAYSVFGRFDGQVRLSAVVTPSVWWIEVADQNIRDINFSGILIPGTLDGPFMGTPPQSGAPRVAGRIAVVDDAGASQALPAGLMIRASGHLTAVRLDGSFRLPMRNGTHMMAFTSLPAGYSVRSMTRGAVNLLTTPLLVDPATPSEEVRITLEFDRRAAAEGRNRIANGAISGRLLNGNGSPVANASVHAVLGLPGPAVATSVTDGGGNYRLENLPPNIYSIAVGELSVGLTRQSFVTGSNTARGGSSERVPVGYGMNVDLGSAIAGTSAGGAMLYNLQR
jgi:hypothetical protein